LIEKQVKQLAFAPSLFSLVPLPISNFLLVALPYSSMESSPKKAKQDLRNLNQENADLIRKLMAAFEKHLKINNQSQAKLEQDLKKVKRNPTLRIFVKRIGSYQVNFNFIYF
jgi:hypothetical protein